MFYLTDTYPAYCPACARTPMANDEQRRIFYFGDTQQCACGARFTHLSPAKIAELNGALHSQPQCKI